MKFYTDGKTVVEAEHRAGAFDKLQEIYGHSSIGDIYTARNVLKRNFFTGYHFIKIVDEIFEYDKKEIKWIKEEEKNAQNF